jgi:hypothetical protein
MLTKKANHSKSLVCYVSSYLILLCFWLPQASLAQINLSTAGLPWYNGGNGLGGNAAVSFVVENTNSNPVVLQNISVHWRTQNNGSMATLWWSATDLSGPTNFGSQQWSKQVTTGPISVTANGIIPTFSNVNVLIPGNSEIRFAIESNNGISYSGSPGSVFPPDSIIASSGVRLKNGTALINGLPVGGSGFFPVLDVFPRFFTGTLQVFPVGPCTAPSIPQVKMFPTQICAGNGAILDATGINYGQNMQFQWQSSPDDINWTNIPGATQHFAAISPTSNTYYRLRVTCGANTVFSPSHMAIVHGGNIPASNVTINSGAPTAGNNFNSFKDFIDFLGFCNVLTGPIEVAVVPNSGPYVERVVFKPIAGSSATNTITINGNGNRLTWSAASQADQATVLLDGISNLIIDNLHIEATGNTFAFGVHIVSQSGNNTIRNSHIEVPEPPVGVDPHDFRPITMGRNTINSTNPLDYPGNHNLIENNTLRGGLTGIFLSNQTTLPSIGNKIYGNNVVDFQQFGFFIRNQIDLEITGNTLSRPGVPNTGNFVGINFNGNMSGARITKNAFHTTGGMASSAANNLTQIGIRVENAFGDSAKPILIANNVMYNFQSRSDIRCIDIRAGSDFINIYHNTFHIESNVAGKNITNIFSASNTTQLDIRNNIFSLGGSASKRHYWFTSSTSLFINRNIYHADTSAGGTYLVAQNQFNTFPTLASWTTIPGVNFLSIQADPEFIDPAAGILIPQSSIASNNGGAVGITEDFFGNPRPPTNPDRGAFQFVPVTQDLMLSHLDFIQNVCLGATDSIIFQVQNRRGGLVNFATDSLTIEWNITGPNVLNGTFVINTGSLDSGATRSFSTTTSINQFGNYTISAWLLPSTTNQSPFNDSLEIQRLVENQLQVSPQSLNFTSHFETALVSAQLGTLPKSIMYISEICYRKDPNGAPINGWPVYLDAENYIEISGPPGFDLAGFTLEQWTTQRETFYTFPSGTIFSPQGTMILAVGSFTSSTPSPSDFYYHGIAATPGSIPQWLSNSTVGTILKDPNGRIVDAVGYGQYHFPSSANVPATEWSNPVSAGFSNSGLRLIGPDINSGLNWLLANTNDPNNLIRRQNPNTLNANTPFPTHLFFNDFYWTHNGVVVDSNPTVRVGPFAADGTYFYVANLVTPCGVFTDTVTINVATSGGNGSRIQFINNGLDPQNQSVDIWINNQKLISSLNFLASSDFEVVPSQTPLVIAVTPANDPNTSNALLTTTINLDFGISYIAVFSGAQNTNKSENTPMELLLFPNAREYAQFANQVDLLFFHGATGWSRLNVSEFSIPVANLVKGLGYGDFTDYLGLPFQDYDFIVSTTYIGARSAGFRTPASVLGLNGRAVFILISNTLDSNGVQSLNLFLTRPDGGPMVPLLVAQDVGLQEIQLAKLIKAYPNPTQQNLFVELKTGYRGDIIFKVMDANGRIHLERTQRSDGYDTFEFDVSRLAAGQYFVRIQAGNQMDVQPIQIVR